VTLKAFAANFFHIDPRTIVFRSSDGNILQHEMLQNLNKADPNQLISLHVEIQPPQSPKDNPPSIMTQTEVRSSDNITQTQQMLVDSSSSQTLAVPTSEHQTQTIVKPVVQSQVQTAPDQTEVQLKEARERIKELERTVQRLQDELNTAHATINQNSLKPDYSQTVRSLLSGQAFEQLIKENVKKMTSQIMDLVVEEQQVEKRVPGAWVEEKQAVDHYPAPPVVSRQDSNPQGIEMEEIDEEYVDAVSSDINYPSKPTDTGLISSLFSLINPAKNPQAQPQQEQIADMPELLQQLLDMGFTDALLNEKVLRFQWSLGEKNLDAVVTDLLQRQMAL